MEHSAVKTVSSAEESELSSNDDSDNESDDGVLSALAAAAAQKMAAKQKIKVKQQRRIQVVCKDQDNQIHAPYLQLGAWGTRKGNAGKDVEPVHLLNTGTPMPETQAYHHKKNYCATKRKPSSFVALNSGTDHTGAHTARKAINEQFKTRAPNMTKELKRELQILQMRRYLDPKRFYKGKALFNKKLPTDFEVGTVVPTVLDERAMRHNPRKLRQKSMTDTILRDKKFKKYSKRKYLEIQLRKQGGGRLAHMEKKRKRNKYMNKALPQWARN